MGDRRVSLGEGYNRAPAKDFSAAVENFCVVIFLSLPTLPEEERKQGSPGVQRYNSIILQLFTFNQDMHLLLKIAESTTSGHPLHRSPVAPFPFPSAHPSPQKYQEAIFLKVV